MSRWWRAYDEAVNDPPIVLLSDGAFRLWFNLRCVLAWQGQMPPVDLLPWYARLKKRKFERLLSELLNAGLVAKDETGALRIIKRSYETDRPAQSEWATIRARIFERDDFTCRYCGERGTKLQCDHVIPVARGGAHSDDNLVTACEPCNRSKAAKPLNDWLANR